ncbi:hypothetical protein [Bacillus norwichensis]|uniref:Lycopene cyclase domain-containing protein n=1 Tax=Bacillus norwichensis TaxID=2762217 RepID=A0ABR8VPF7_9BACI|nr:hypothetical protein [Bacillus norwichensis]MBD8006642.1 hypothetical protein [Bacillus norwichensis]
MNPIFILIILFSLVVSTSICFYALKKVNKWKLISCVFFVNTIILGGASALFYKIDPQKFHKGSYGLFDSLGIGALLFFIPIITWINIIVIQLRKNS